MGRKYKTEYENADGWSDWIYPTPREVYRFACCDCGLVHKMEFTAVEASPSDARGYFTIRKPADVLRVGFRAARDSRATAGKRRGMK